MLNIDVFCNDYEQAVMKDDGVLWGLTGVVCVKADLHPIRVTGHKHTGGTLICCRGTFISQTVIKLHLHLCSPQHQALLQQEQLSHHSSHHMTSEAEIWCDLMNWWQVKSSQPLLYSAFNNTDCVKALNSIKLEDRVSVMYNNKIKHSIFS